MGPQNSHDQYINGQSLPTSPIFGGQAQYSERDPQGLNASTPGAKLDSGKQRPWLVLRMGFGRALQAVTRIGTKGAAKYSDNGWKSVQNGYARYMEAFGRHQDALDLGKVLDDGLGGTGESHIACMVWNLLAAEEFRLARLAGFSNVQHWHDSLGIGTPPIADISAGHMGRPMALGQIANDRIGGLSIQDRLNIQGGIQDRLNMQGADACRKFLGIK